MENRINISELLKDCPEDMELYSPLFGNCKFIKVHDYEAEIIVEIETGANVSFKTDGRYYDYPNAECILFPKGKTTWEGFVPPCIFKDGDILFVEAAYNWILIYKENENKEDLYKYVATPIHPNHTYIVYDDNPLCCKKDISKIRFATKEEKTKLFQAIKDNGYKWNSETKTLEKVPKIKDGDIVYIKTSLSEWVSIFEKFDDDECKCYVNYCIDSDTYYGKIGGKKNPLCYIDEIVEQRLATEEEKQKLFDVIKENGHQWNTKTKTLEKVIKPKFKVGDRIRDRNGFMYTVSSIGTLGYILNDVHKVCVEFKEQDKYELFQNKFDINTLKPFQKVLVRDSDKKYWGINLFGFYNEITKQFHCMGNSNIGWNECIPYESNEHLLGTTNDCDEFYKNWK